jgi:hypothetical protein
MQPAPHESRWWSRAALFALAAVAVWSALPAKSLRADEHFDKHVKPFLAKHCIDCHDGDSPEGMISLGQFGDTTSAAAKADLWYKVQSVLKNGKMPPKDEERPAEDQVKQMVEWIDRDVLKIDCDAPRDPGRVTIRRLNRTEYANTIRDLVGVDFKATDDFPVDDSGYGFDNIGDVLSTSPLLLEKYLAAAEKITAEAIDANHPTIAAPRKRIEAESLEASKDSGSAALGGFMFASNGSVKGSHEFPKAGKYAIRFRAFGQQAGDELPKLNVSIDGKEVHVFDVEAVQEDPHVYEATIDIEAGKREISFGFINDYYNPEARRRNGRDRNLFVDYCEIQGPLEGDASTLKESHKAIVFTSPRTSGKSVERSAREVLRKFATRAYRRPVEDSELSRLVKFVKRVDDDGESFERGIQLAMQAVLVSPHFLFRIERDEFPDDPAKIHNINEYELATRLSYFLWSSMPDEELMREARADRLRKNLDAQITRMLADPKAQALVANFSGQWLETRKLATVTPDAKQFGEFDDALRDAMRQEAELLFGTVMRENLPVTTLLDAKFTFLNERLAKHYGIESVKGNEFRRVELSDDRRGGVLTLASVLTVTSNPTRTSPVKRGKWIMEQILGTPPPPPPPNVPELQEAEGEAATGSLRERMAAHLSNPTCASCHVSMDALGLAFENYDAVGRWRDKDGKFDIDPAGETPDGKKFAGSAALKKALADADRDLFVRCLSEKMLTYALGRGLEYYDKCTVDDLWGATSKDNYRFSALVKAIVHSDAFQKRRAKRPDK